MENYIEGLRGFLNRAHSPYHVASDICGRLASAGYRALSEGEHWGLLPGGKYYVVRGDSSVIAFRIPETEPVGFMMAAAHDDFPGFAVKDDLTHEGKYSRLDTETYGAMIMHTWLDRPLSLAGRGVVETQQGVRTVLLDVDRDVALIPSVAIHLNREVNNGTHWNPAVDLQPLLGGPGAGEKLRAALEEQAGGKLLGWDLRLYLRQKASVWGMEEEYLSAPGLDDLACAYGALEGFLTAGEGSAIPVLCVFDNEEVGSSTMQGAGSDFLEATLERVCRSRGLCLKQMLSRSFLVSADNGHAVHPNHPELADQDNAPVLGGGVMLKHHANRRYTTDGLSAALLRKLGQMAGVPLQDYYNRADMKGGSTLGCVSLAHVAVNSVDIGLPQLAMHAACETVACQDARDLYTLFKTYFAQTIQPADDGEYRLI